MSKQLLIAGFHRSGTSMLTQILYRAGLFVGERLMSPNISNADGHFEDMDFYHFHEKLLRFNQTSWQYTGETPLKVSAPYRKEMHRLSKIRDASHSVWGFKDPRSVLFLPEWYSVLSQPHTLVIYRHYSETSRSLLHRASGDWLVNPKADQLLFWQDSTLAYRMWLAYHRQLLQHIKAHPETTLVVSQDAVLHGFPIVEEVNKHFGFTLDTQAPSGIDSSKVSQKAVYAPMPNNALKAELDAVWEALQAVSLAPAKEVVLVESASKGVTLEDIAKSVEVFSEHSPQDDIFAETLTLLHSSDTMIEEKVKQTRQKMRLFFSVGQQKRLIDTVKRVAEEKQNNTMLWSLLGDLHRLNKEEKEAQYDDLKEMTSISSIRPREYRKVAEGYLYFRRFEMAELFLEKAISQNPVNPLFYISKANLESTRCCYSEALSAFDKAIVLLENKSLEIIKILVQKCDIYLLLDDSKRLKETLVTIYKLKEILETTLPEGLEKRLNSFEEEEEKQEDFKKLWREKLEKRLKEEPFMIALSYALDAIEDAVMKQDLIERIFEKIESAELGVVEPKVNFLVIGAQKSGTTALYEYLKMHPDICMSGQKELHFFDNEEYFDTKIVPYQQYHHLFDCPENVKMVGEVTPIYMYWKDAVERIYQYNPNMKLIILLRNPIERAYSHWNMERGRGNENFSFSEAIRQESKRCREALPYQHRVYSYTDRGFYTSQLREVWRFFDKSNVLVLKHDTLKHDLKDVLSEVASFLDVTSFQEVEEKEYFATPYQKQMNKEDRAYLQNLFYEEIKSLEKMLGWDCHHWLTEKKKKKVLFLRDFKGYTGGHQKVYDYYQHLKAHDEFHVEISFTEDSVWNKNNPWIGEYQHIVQNPNYDEYDFLFVAGMDWERIPEGIEEKIPVINLIQGFRHANPKHALYKFLSRKAIRIAVSQEVADAILDTNSVNGSVYTIPNGHSMPQIEKDKSNDIFILGKKNALLAKELEKRLVAMGYRTVSTTHFIEREEVFHTMASSHISVVLPNQKESEGFFLPALEAMKYSDITIVPDCVGNRSFCFNQKNCLMPEYEKEAILDNIKEAMKIILKDKQTLQKYREEVYVTLELHSIDIERNKFYQLLDEVLCDV